MKRLAAVCAVVSFVLSLGVSTSVAHADQAPVLDRPQIVQTSLGFCSAASARRGACELGAPIVRVTLAVPECWTVEVGKVSTMGASFAYTARAVQGCTLTGAAPAMRRFIVQL